MDDVYKFEQAYQNGQTAAYIDMMDRLMENARMYLYDTQYRRFLRFLRDMFVKEMDEVED